MHFGAVCYFACERKITAMAKGEFLLPLDSENPCAGIGHQERKHWPSGLSSGLSTHPCKLYRLQKREQKGWRKSSVILWISNIYIYFNFLTRTITPTFTNYWYLYIQIIVQLDNFATRIYYNPCTTYHYKMLILNTILLMLVVSNLV